METRVPQHFCKSYSPILTTCLCHPDRLLGRCCHPTGNGSPCPELMLVAMETARGETEGRWPALTAICSGTVAQLGCCLSIAAAPSSTVIPLVSRQKASASVICPHIAAVSECLPCARHGFRPCPCASMVFNPPLSLLYRYSSFTDILKWQFDSVITQYTILEFRLVD